jgi:hypothetical protein
MFTLDQIVALLNQFNQRATYGALAEVVGGVARSVMSGRPRAPLNSWIVRRRSGLPTGYVQAQMAPNLLFRPQVFTTGAALQQWLLNPN